MVLAALFSNPSPSPLSRAIAAYRKLSLSESCRRRAPRIAPKRALRLNAAQLDQLVQSYRAGATVYDLAALFSIDRRTVSMHLKRQGEQLRRRPPPADLINEMVRMYRSGLSLARVSEGVGVSAGTVLRQLNDRGVTTRDTHGRPR